MLRRIQRHNPEEKVPAMSLTGHLDVFPLEEVLRLLARSYKSGCLRVDSAEVHGRIFLNSGSLSFATVGTDDELRRQLISSELVGEEALRAAEIGGRSLSGSTLNANQLGDLFREEIVESLYRIRRPGRGQFVFNVDVAPRYRSEEVFDVELCVSEADRRAAEWADVESVIPTIDLNLRIAPNAPNNEPVTLAPNTWRLIASFEGTSSVRALSDRLGLSRFRTAKDLTALVRAGLVEPVVTAPAAEAPRVTLAPEPVAEMVPPERVAESPGEVSHDRGWWTEPVDEPVTAEEGPAEETFTEEPVAGETTLAESGVPRAFEPSADQPSGEAAETAPTEEESRESFLDKVFAQLNESPESPANESSTVGHGFLKRRRMSSVGLDD
ncbi:MAG: DUF4388 domain-containing protein [Actinomycetota bacterium]